MSSTPADRYRQGAEVQHTFRPSQKNGGEILSEDSVLLENSKLPLTRVELRRRLNSWTDGVSYRPQNVGYILSFGVKRSWLFGLFKRIVSFSRRDLRHFMQKFIIPGLTRAKIVTVSVPKPTNPLVIRSDRSIPLWNVRTPIGPILLKKESSLLDREAKLMIYEFVSTGQIQGKFSLKPDLDISDVLFRRETNANFLPKVENLQRDICNKFYPKIIRETLLSYRISAASGFECTWHFRTLLVRCWYYQLLPELWFCLDKTEAMIRLTANKGLPDVLGLLTEFKLGDSKGKIKLPTVTEKMIIAARQSEAKIPYNSVTWGKIKHDLTAVIRTLPVPKPHFVVRLERSIPIWDSVTKVTPLRGKLLFGTNFARRLHAKIYGISSISKD